MDCTIRVQIAKSRMRLLSLLLIMLLYVAGSTRPGNAQGSGQPLPALPDRAISDKIIKATGGPTLTPLGVPAPITNQFLSLAIILDHDLITGKKSLTADQFFDLPHAVYFANLDGGLKSVLVPMLNLSTTQLAPSMQTPDGVSAMLLGAVFSFDSGPSMLVLTWKDSNAPKPSDVRVYTLVNGTPQFTTPYKVFYRKFKGNKNGKVAAGDQGLLVAARETCFSVGMDQVCFSPTKQDKQADPKAASSLNDAVTALSKTYNITAKIDVDGALSEIAGPGVRTACAAKLAQATAAPTIPKISECAITMIFAGVSDTQAGQPIGALSLLKDIDLPAFDLQGNPVSKLLAGNYLILDATADLTDPGTPGVLMLVNADGKNHFLIPSQVIEGFGDSDDKDANSRKGQAGVKDATVGAHGF